ncbi:MAG: transcription elongation factor GreA [bacterium]
MALKQINITKDGLEKIQAELRELESNRRPMVVERIRHSKEFGDLSENAEYTEAKEEQGFIEGRIAELKQIINNAVVVEKAPAGGLVGIGSKIKVHSESETEREFIIVGAEEADPHAGKISDQSPIGRALLGKMTGEVVSVQTPKGVTTFKILSVE